MKKLFILFVLFSLHAGAQQFVHPGINQSGADLALMKTKVQEGREPWKSAFAKLKASCDTNFIFRAHTHVLRGPFGKPNIGGDDLSRSANKAYELALMWYITNDKAYAQRSIDILNAWSAVLWDFDYNDAKLLAAWTGHSLCNAAEILRYTNAGWKPQDIDRFRQMLTTVYYPLLRFYFPNANGNWDGAIIHTILAMGIFTDNRAMFDNAVDHFLHGPVNGSLFKYIYPSGQCQETPRDQAHVQLGLGEFAGAAQVAYTQGVDLFSIGNNRIAAGYEFTAGYLLGKKTEAYGVIADRAKAWRDEYEYVSRHYAAKGVDIPNTMAAADSVRGRAYRAVLTSTRVAFENPAGRTAKPGTKAVKAGAGQAGIKGQVTLVPGENIQQALNNLAGKNQVLVLKEGVHTLPGSLKMPSGVTLAGEGLKTILYLVASSTERDAIVNGENDLHDVTIRDLVIEGSVKLDRGTDPNSSRSFRNEGNRGGIVFRALADGQMKNLKFINITVKNCTYNGVFIAGASGLEITNCDFDENGSSVIPGPRLQHNLLLSHCSKITVTNSRFDTSPFGAGISVLRCDEARISNCEIARNAWYGLQVAESSNVEVSNSLIEGNDHAGAMMEFFSLGNRDIKLVDNTIWYNGGYGIEAYGSSNVNDKGNRLEGNGRLKEQTKLSTGKKILLDKE